MLARVQELVRKWEPPLARGSEPVLALARGPLLMRVHQAQTVARQLEQVQQQEPVWAQVLQVREPRALVPMQAWDLLRPRRRLPTHKAQACPLRVPMRLSAWFASRACVQTKWTPCSKTGIRCAHFARRLQAVHAPPRAWPLMRGSLS